MLAMTSVTVEKCVFNFLYSTGGPSKHRGAQGNLPSTFLLDGSGCVINALIMH